MDKDKEHADKAAATKKAADEQAKKAADEQDAALDKAAGKNRIENRDQDPDHPANKTLSPTREAIPRPAAEGITVPPEEMLTEQEKDAAAGGEGAGVGPISASETTTGPVETIEDQGIGPRTPYPTGNPPPDTVITTRSQGINNPDKPLDARVKPGETVRKEPAR